MNSWHIEGVAECPRCCLYYDFDGTLTDLHVFITAHDCAPASAKEEPAQ